MERFDVVDIDGVKTGLVANKGVALSEWQYYLGVYAYIDNSSNEFLLQQRAFSKVFLPGSWDIHMGHVIAGESSKEGLAREINAEIGLIFQEEQLSYVGKTVWEIRHHLIDIYFLKVDYNLDNHVLQAE